MVREEWEREQVHRLNHEAFAVEVGQHERRADGRLVDRFDAENTYFGAFDGERLVGMIALRGERPFSLDAKMADLDGWLPAGRPVCEVRLLYVQREWRSGPLCARLVGALVQEGRRRGYGVAVISGIRGQRRLYEHMGFTAFAEEVRSGQAVYQPMMVRMEDLERRCGQLLRRRPIHDENAGEHERRRQHRPLS